MSEISLEMPNASVTSIPTHSRRSSMKFLSAKLISVAIPVAIGLIVYFVIPKPTEVSKQAWRLLAIFLTTIAGLMLQPVPLGAWSIVCLTVSLVTKTQSFKDAFEAFTNQAIWLMVISFFFSRGFVKTGLGDRMAMYLVRWLGKSTLGLAYGLAIGEALISIVMPSATARAGGVFLPIILSLATASESSPEHRSARKIGAFLIQSQLQSSSSSNALFLTGDPQNMLCMKLAESLGVKVKSLWVTWLKASCIPAMSSLMLTPFIIYMIFPPEIKRNPDAPIMAKQKLEQMGHIKRNEWIMMATMLVVVTLWIFGEWLHISSINAAMMGLSVLFMLDVLSWDDCLSEKSAWDILAWFALLLGMANQLSALGIVQWLSKGVASFLKSLSVGWHVELLILQCFYFFIHYMFAGQTTHIGALYSAFLSMHLKAKVPGSLSALLLAYNADLFGALTHYSSGQAAIYYGAGYVKLEHFFMLGILMSHYYKIGLLDRLYKLFRPVPRGV